MNNNLEVYVRKDGELDLIATIDTEEFIVNNLEENNELQSKYDKYREVMELEDCYQSAIDFAESLDGKGIYGEGKPIVLNTFNEESLLSDVLQLVYWTDDNGEYVILERHLGGDPRGNYGPQQAYDVTNELSVFNHASGSISCQDCSEEWITDDAFHWSNENGLKDLQDYKASKEPVEYPLQGFPSMGGVVFVDDKERPHCPCCGGLLEINEY